MSLRNPLAFVQRNAFHVGGVPKTTEKKPPSSNLFRGLNGVPVQVKPSGLFQREMINKCNNIFDSTLC